MSCPCVAWVNAATRAESWSRSAASTRRPLRARDRQIAVPRPPMPPLTTAMRGFMEWECRSRTREGASALVAGLLVVRAGTLAHVAREIALELVPQLQVALGELVHHRPRGLPDHAAHLAAELLLLVQEDLHRALQVIAHEALQRVAVEADDLAQQLRRQH